MPQAERSAAVKPRVPESGCRRPLLPCALHRLYEYAAMVFGLGVLGFCSLVWTAFAVPLYILLPKRWGVPIGRGMISHSFRMYLGSLTWIGAFRFDLSELDTLRHQGPMIVAPNHPCLLDALLVLSRLPGMACVMKAEIIDNAFFGAGARLAGYIRNDAQLSMIKQSVAELASGSQLLIFPEATRTTRWPVNAFKGTTALIARRAQVPIQTVFIETESAYLGKGWSLFRRPNLPITYRFRLGQRFDPPDKAAEFTDALERYFIDELCDAPHFLPPGAPHAPGCDSRRRRHAD